MKILCVEDDQGLAGLIQQALIKQHYQVELATDGLMGWNLAETETYDLILLDWMLPKLTGIKFCQQLRTEKYSVLNPNRDTPVLLMTAMDTVTHKVMGLNAGADDYVVKPLDLDELLARVRALMRRSQTTRSPLLHWGEVCLNPNRCEVMYQSQPIALGPKEYELLELFLRNPDQIFSLNRLLTALWNIDDMPSEGAVRAHIKGLRQKLKQAGAEDPIDTLYKLGYRLKPWQGQGEPHQDGVAKDGLGKDSLGQDSGGAATSPSSAFISPELWETWQTVRPSYCDRLSNIQQAVTALHAQTLTPAQRQAANREVHTLVGSLGCFGLADASTLARQIQHRFKADLPLEPPEIEQLGQWVAELRLQVETATSRPIEAIAPLPPTAPGPIPRLLIVDRDRPWAQAVATAAAAEGWQAQLAATLAEAQQGLQDGRIQAMLLNLDVADADGQSLAFLTTVQCQYPTLPVMALTAQASLERRIAVARLGSRYCVQTPIDPARLWATAAPLLEPPPSSPAQVLIVDQDPAYSQRLRRLLAAAGYGVTLLSQPEQFCQTLAQTAPDLLIVAAAIGPRSASAPLGQATLSPVSGLDLCQVIRSDPDWCGLPVVVVSAQGDRDAVQACFAAGADDVLDPSFTPQELLTRLRNRLNRRGGPMGILHRSTPGSNA